MELLERETYLADLRRLYKDVEGGTGHTAFLIGEAGIGKTSLLNNFLNSIAEKSTVLIGACDSLFTPRPLGPLFDIALEIDEDFSKLLSSEKDRAVVFSALFTVLATSRKPVVLVFEDIHWADDATFDLVKFLSRRINKTRCLFIVSFRDNEIVGRHSMASMFGELPVGHFSKFALTRLSKQIVSELAMKSHNLTGDQLFELTSGNPFYVMEILSQGNRLQIPERIKDSILARFHGRSEQTRSLWEFLSVLPSPKIDRALADYIDTAFGNCMEECITAGIIVSKPGQLSFNHELFRITIEESLSHSRRKMLHKSILQILQRVGKPSLSQLVHHAKYAEEFGLVSDLAPRAAKEASDVGAHREAATLYSIAIDVSEQGSFQQAELYERHAYECYLTYQLSAAIASQQQALTLWRNRDQKLREGDALRFLSRLWWFAGDRGQAVQFGSMAIEVLDNLETPLRERAWAYSNFAQLEMLSENTASTLTWGKKAIELATQINDQEVLSHALNNVGTALLRTPYGRAEGEANLRESLAIGLRCKFQEHAARSYVNLGYTFYLIKEYAKAKEALTLGIKYCEERDLDFLRYYMMACMASVNLETGNWENARVISLQLYANAHHVLVKIIATLTLAKIAMREGDFKKAKELNTEIRDAAMATKEIQRILPLVTSELEFGWLTGEVIDQNLLSEVESKFFSTKNNSWFYTEYAYWKRRVGSLPDEDVNNFLTPLKLEFAGDWKAASLAWEKIGCPYEQALALMDGTEESQNEGMRILNNLKATGTINHYRRKLNLKSPKPATKGPRESTLNNPGQLTDRQIDILKLLHVGLQNKEIAEKLFISPKTVDHHISAILTKLEVSSRTKAVIEAKKLGILV
jgi:ATP/maltotriose-dependent transcriptional regulator MalT